MLKSKLDTDKLTVKIGLFFSQLGISPNTWTLLAFIPAVLGLLSLWSCQDLWKGLTFFLLAGFLDMIDGSVARVTGRATNKGAFLDGIVDRYVEFLLYLGLFFYGVASEWIILLLFGAMMPSYVRAYAHHRGIITREQDHKRMGGLLERAERLILIYLAMLAGIFNPLWLGYLIIVTAILANFTALGRIWFVWSYQR